MLKRFFYSICIGFCIASVLSLALWAGLLETWNTKVTDSLFLPRPPDKSIAIIAIDDKSIRAIGRWPWDREVHAKLLDILASKATAVGLDVSFLEPSDKDSDTLLANSLERFKSVVLAMEARTIVSSGTVVETQELLTPVPQFSSLAPVGLVNMLIDADGTTRFAPIALKPKGEMQFTSFSMEVVQMYRKARGMGELADVPTENGFMRINYVGAPGTFPTYSFIDVLNGGIPAETFSEKIVLIGATAQDLHDTVVTPVSHGKLMSGVEAHANTIQTILSGRYLFTEPTEHTMYVLFFLAISASLVFIFGRVILSTATMVTLLVGYTIYAFTSFDHGMIRNMIFPPIAIISVYIAQLLYKYVLESAQKRFLRKAFSYYLSESVLTDVLKDPKKLALGGVRREMTVLFSDIGGFTTLAEILEPETLASLLNDYLTRMTKIVFTHSGVLDKYIGDAVMAFWGAPVKEKQHALLACKTALSMLEEIEKIKRNWAEVQNRPFNVRIGINTGEVVVGNMGSDVRFDYTVLGDGVNLASRLEGVNKLYGTNILISESTYHHVEDVVVARRLDTVAVKGKNKGITIYELRRMGEAVGEEKKFLDAFEAARVLYQHGKFKRACAAFKELVKLYPQDRPTDVYVMRLKELAKHPPADWDGVYHSDSK